MGDMKTMQEKGSEASPAKVKPKLNMYALACAMLASMNSILAGYGKDTLNSFLFSLLVLILRLCEIGLFVEESVQVMIDVAVISGASLFIKADLKINDTQLEILAGIINLYSLIGSLAAGRTSDWLGRRYTIIFASAIFFAGALTTALAPNYPVIMLGRFIVGIGVGYALLIAPVYTAEVAPASARGFLTSFPELCINFGILLGYIANFAFAKLPHHIGWRMMFGAGAIPPVFLAAATLLMPESPRWLVMQGRLGEARRVLSKISDTPAEVENRLAAIKEAAGIPEYLNDDVIVVPKRNRSGEGVWRDLLIRPTPSVRRIVIAAMGLQFFQQASGIDSVVLYSPRVFGKAGLTSKTQLLGDTMAVGFTKTAFILVATFLSDRIGRRPLLLTSAGGMVVSLLLLASGLLVIDRNSGHTLTWAVAMSIAAMLAFVGSFSIGLGPIAWVYTSEIFPLRLRAQGTSLGTAMNRVMSGVITMSFISLYKAISVSGSFYLYAGIATVGWVFLYVFLPETQGRALEDMEEIFGGKKKFESGEVGKGNEDELSS